MRHELIGLRVFKPLGNGIGTTVSRIFLSSVVEPVGINDLGSEGERAGKRIKNDRLF